MCYIIKVNEPLKLDGAENIRDLGDYEAKEGKKTRNKIYLRGDRTHELSERDIKKLINYGVTLEIDLRSPREVGKFPSKLKGAGSIRYENVIMFDSIATMTENLTMPESLFDLYKNLLETGKKQYKAIFKLLLENNGVSFFHCSAGKDRTGVLSLLILQLAGVSDEIIVSDYAASEDNLVDFLVKQAKIFDAVTEVDVPGFVLTSKAHEMENTIKYLRDNYGSAKNYLLETGLTEQELDRLNEKFVK